MVTANTALVEPPHNRVLGKFLETCQTITLDQWNIHTKYDKTTISEIESDNLAYLQRMTFIILTSDLFEMYIKAHFMLKDADYFFKFRTGKDAPEPAETVDFMREFCNVLAGKIKSGCEDLGLEVNQSLPLSMQGYNQIFTEMKEQSAPKGAWKLESEGSSIVISISIKTQEHAVLQKLETIAYKKQDASDMGDIELF